MGSEKETSRELLLKQIDAAIQKIDKKRGKTDDQKPVEPKPDRRA